MGSLRFGAWALLIVTIFLSLLLPACGGHKPAGSNPFPIRITLNPSPSFSLQAGGIIQLTATAQNDAGQNISSAFTFSSNNPGILDVAPSGTACAGTWNAPLYTVCTPQTFGMVQVTASALGVTSPPTLIFVHPPIDTITISVVPPVNSPPPACPNQQPLPVACNITFTPTNRCLSQNQIETLQARAFSQGVDITGSVGPFTWTQANANVAKITPIVDSSINVATYQATAAPNTPGQTEVIASASGVFSQPYYFETCPVQCIDLELGVSGLQHNIETSFAVNKGTSETITATAVDVQGCIVPKPPLTWTSSEPAALSAGGAAGCAAGTTCTVSTTQPGVASITASCSPPTCNIGFPLNPLVLPAPYIPQPVYPVTAISGLVTGSPVATSVLATSQDCYSDPLCDVALYNVSTSTNLPGSATQLPTPPNSLMFDPPGDKAFTGSEFGAVVITPGNLGGTSSPFSFLAAPGTPRGVVTGKFLSSSPNGATAIFSDTISIPNQVYVVTSSPSSTAPLNINSATAAAFSPDELKALILGNGGNTLYVYSTLQSLQIAKPNPLPTPATSVVFNSTGSFALLSGGAPAGSLALYNTCDNSSVTLSAPALPGPPLFLKMVPSGNVSMGNALIPNLQTTGLDFFFGLDNTGIDIVATNTSPAPLTTLCPQPVALAHTPQNITFAPVHVDIGYGTFHPINFFLSPDSTQAYIVTSDFGVLIYNFITGTVSRIQLVGDASAVAADMTVDGTLIYVAASDGQLHELNIETLLDQNQISFPPLPNSLNPFCYTGANCALNLVAVKP